MKSTLLIHLHPDFATELKDLFKRWNMAQGKLEIIGLRPRHKWDAFLLTSGSISDNKACRIADTVRMEAEYSPDDSIIVFTEKRLYDDDYYQLFVSGREVGEEPPAIGVISLEYLRKLYSKNNSSSLMFKAIISNILFSLGIDAGLKDHGQATKGCIMDFCDDMDDIVIGLENGPRFCSVCLSRIKKNKQGFLLTLVDVFVNTPNIKHNDKRITETILKRGELRKKDKGDFNYDIALSFAGEDRKYARQLAQRLEASHIKVFYDEFEQAKLWGRSLDIYLSDVYRLKAKYCIVFLSKYYKEKRWTNHELRAALSRAFEGNEDYVLPIRLDDTEIQGILPTQGYISWNDYGPDKILTFVKQKLQDYRTPTRHA